MEEVRWHLEFYMKNNRITTDIGSHIYFIMTFDTFLNELFEEESASQLSLNFLPTFFRGNLLLSADFS